MKFKIAVTIVVIVWLGLSESSGQIYSYPEAALTLSRTQTGGTARIRAMGGAQNALGGDLSSAFYNPAGLGMYNRSELALSPGYSVGGSTADYLGTSTDASKGNVMVPNLGVAFHSGKDGTKGLWGGTFAINFNRINDFNSTFSYKGTNSVNSIIDYFINAANGTDSTQFQSGTSTRPEGYNYNTPVGLAYNNYLIGPLSDFFAGGSKIIYDSPVPYQPTIQDETIKTSGAQNQWSFSYGVNFSDKFFIGGGLGLTTLRYKTSITYNETYTMDPLIKMQLTENLELSGSGINLTLGTIFRPVDNVQVGLSMATPTSYQINDTYNAVMSSNWNNYAYYPTLILSNEKAETDILTSSYTLNTPWRFSGGLAFFIQKHGFISADAEYLSYGSSKYSNKQGADQDNQNIRDLYKSVLNIRVGGEYRLNSYRFRAGYNYMPDPYTSQQNGVDRTITSYTAGAGYRQEKFYLDLAVIYQQGNATHSPYAGSPNVSLANRATSFVVTVGFPF